MSRTVYVAVKEAHPEHGHWIPSHLIERTNAAHQVIEDSMRPIMSMVNGQMFDSKSKYAEHLRVNGKMEVGNERESLMRFAKEPDTYQETKREVVEAYHQIKGKYGR